MAQLTKEQFFELIKKVLEFDRITDKLHDLNIQIFDAFPQVHELEDLFINSFLTKEGADWYYWYMYEAPTLGEGPHAWEKDGTPIIMDSPEDLWNYIVNNNYLR